MSRHTKILATLGPASSDLLTLERMVHAGLDVVRMNFSHGKPEDHVARAETIRDASARAGRPIGILADLQGPKIRVGKFEEGRVTLSRDAPFILDARCELGRPARRPRLQGPAQGREAGRRAAHVHLHGGCRRQTAEMVGQHEDLPPGDEHGRWLDGRRHAAELERPDRGDAGCAVHAQPQRRAAGRHQPRRQPGARPDVNPLFPATVRTHYTMGVGWNAGGGHTWAASVAIAPKVTRTNPAMFPTPTGGALPGTVSHSQTTMRVNYNYNF